MHYLFFDTETTGKDPSTARLVQLAYAGYDQDGKETMSRNVIIKPEGFIIPIEATLIHGISQHEALEKGQPLSTIIMDFFVRTTGARELVAHNVQYDFKVIVREMMRTHFNTNNLAQFVKMPFRCTMEESTNYCGLPGYYGKYKWPQLGELHQILFGEKFEGAHNALNDVRATAKCFFELQRLGVMKAAKIGAEGQ